MTLAEFVAETPLYTWREVDLPKFARDLDPGQVILPCDVCGGDRPFRDDRPRGSGMSAPGAIQRPPQPLESGPYLIHLRCGFCSSRTYFVWVEADPAQCRIRKVGQLPPWSVEVKPESAAQLGDDLGLFKRGVICLSQGYGLAACTYFRRVLEHRIDKILELLAQYLALDPATEETAKEVEVTRQGKVGDKKLKQAYPYFPEALQVAGHNPVKLLYEQLSEGVHTLDEDDYCLLAERISGTLLYVLTELARATRARETFIDDIRDLSSP